MIKTLIKALISKTGYEIKKKAPSGFFAYNDLITSHNHDFMNEKKFKAAYKKAMLASGGKDYQTYWRVHVTLSLAAWSTDLGGDFVECGVADGCTAAAICDYLSQIRKQPDNFYLFDTFDGIDTSIVSKKEEAFWKETAENRQKRLNENTYVNGFDFDRVKKFFKPYGYVQVIKGSVPSILETHLAKNKNQKFSFLHIDMNNATPEYEALQFFSTKLTKTAFILLDDYGHQGYEYQKLMADKWAKENNHTILTLPTGQGLIVISS